MLTINETRPGRERLAFRARRFASEVPLGDLGDPVAGATVYRLCIYDAADGLIGGLAVDRAGDVCGRNGASCWEAAGTNGWAYRDPSSSADGVKRVLIRGGVSGKAAVRLKARNKARKGREALPSGLAASLEANDRTTLQLQADDAGCVTAVLARVRRADGVVFRAKTAP